MKIMRELIRSPANANQLAERLGLDYTTIRHHIDILQSSGLVVSQGSKYNVVYFPSEVIEENLEIFNEICYYGKVKGSVEGSKQRDRRKRFRIHRH